MHYLNFLAEMHAQLQPRRYLEIGVRWGNSLSLSRCPSLAIDPDFNINKELHAEIHLSRTTSDEYFARADPLGPVGGEPFDLAFIDGLHLFEFALRDLINAERYSRSTGVLVFDDIMPRTTVEASRVRKTAEWTGDVFQILAVLPHYRPDILVIPVDTSPTGLLLLMGLDPSDTTLSEAYDEVVGQLRHADPQDVPPRLLDRTAVQPAQRVLASGLLELIRSAARDGDDDFHGRLRRAAAQTLGPAFA